ncbi:MAG: hypothetical protein HRT44_07965 [Bdellovibrionales bacterium]|nr:hypothetical protein [Bdellovibrionales bacterium]NQZ19174.1 hypothetical protein [Bdellovibrionales bacterium]
MIDAGTAKAILEISLRTKKLATDFANSKIEDQVMSETIDRVMKEMENFTQSITKKTYEYILISSLGLLPMLASVLVDVPKAAYLIAAIFIIAILAYMAYEFVQLFKRVISFIENYEEEIKKELEISFSKAKEENWKNKFALFISDKKSHHYFETVLVASAQAFCEWIKNNKWQVYIRLASYLVASMSLSVVLQSIF